MIFEPSGITKFSIVTQEIIVKKIKIVNTRNKNISNKKIFYLIYYKIIKFKKVIKNYDDFLLKYFILRNIIIYFIS
jgi:hypothetical protein